jgi:hypothetical protein
MNTGKLLLHLIVLWALLVDSVCGFSSIQCKTTNSIPLFIGRNTDVINSANNQNINDTTFPHIDSFRRKLVVSHILGLFTYQAISQPSNAASASPNDGSDSNKPKTIWMTGKDPIIPGQKPREKGDVSGTRKDPKFLRSLADCKSQCETSSGPDGLARPKDECLSDCQDICCTTYQQCTFAIVTRI